MSYYDEQIKAFEEIRISISESKKGIKICDLRLRVLSKFKISRKAIQSYINDLIESGAVSNKNNLLKWRS